MSYAIQATPALRRATLTLLVVVVIAGCASAPTRWHLNGRTQADLNAAHYQCDQVATSTLSQNQSPGYTGDAASSIVLLFASVALGSTGAQLAYNQCMTSSGFTPAQ